jgi:hypothetical protein
MKNTNTTNTIAALTKLADDSRYMNADAYNVLWEHGKKAKLSRDDLSLLWTELATRSLERKLGHFAGRKYSRGTGVVPSEKELPALPEKPEKPAKQAKAKAVAELNREQNAANKFTNIGEAEIAKKLAETPAKQEKAKKAKDPTQKEILANILTTLVSMDKRLTAIEKKVK